MTRLNLMLLLAVLVSALYLVHTQYESRSLFVELDRANTLARKLVVENERLQVERRTQATPLRVEKLAKEQLQMRSSSPAITQYVTMQAQAAAPTQVPVAGASAGRVQGLQGNDATRPVQ